MDILGTFNTLVNSLTLNLPTIGVLAILLYGWNMLPFPTFTGAGVLIEAAKWVLIVSFLHHSMMK
jgi:hypothetical protein